MLDQLRAEVLDANLEVVRRGLVLYTWGNASGIDRERGLIVIKPSGVPYDKLTAADLVVTDLTGKRVEGSLKPSSDLDTHLALYNAFPAIGGIVHTHSRNATAWAQACKEIPCFGTTHADYFHGSIPCTRELTQAEVNEAYERNTGVAIIDRFKYLDPIAVPGCIVAGHAPFAWGKTPAAAAHNAVVLEEVATMALATITINPHAAPLATRVRDLHYLRKHGPNASYGQKRQ